MDPVTLAALLGGTGLATNLIGFLTRPQTPESPLFSDINLANENPELYQQLQNYQAAIDQAQAAARSRGDGILPSEQRNLDQSLAKLDEQQINLGIAGTEMGNRNRSKAESRLRESIAERAFRERQALEGNVQNLLANKYNMTRAGLQDALSARLGQIQNEQAQAAARNQFYSNLGGGLMSAGANLYGTSLLPSFAEASSGYTPSYAYYAPSSPVRYSLGVDYGSLRGS